MYGTFQRFEMKLKQTNHNEQVNNNKIDHKDVQRTGFLNERNIRNKYVTKLNDIQTVESNYENHLQRFGYKF